MLVLKSTEYKNLGYLPDERMWKFQRVATSNDPMYQEYILSSNVKFVEKASDTVTLFRPNGDSVVTTKNGIKQPHLTVK
jgi:hypothetical protein